MSEGQYKLVLVRHGESVWNQQNLFTGWTDVDLSDKGVREAHDGAKALLEKGKKVCLRSHFLESSNLILLLLLC
jgi:2,3-bisphosphoglycerate-dependent phosphoglycerate mutase